MIIYFYSNKTFEYLYGAEIEEGKNLPPFSTKIEPPSVEQFQVQVFHEDLQEWTIEEDYRQKQDIHGFRYGGKPYYDIDLKWWANPIYTGLIGAIPQGMSFEKMIKPNICFEIIDLQTQYDTLKEELETTDYYARRCYEYEQGWDSDTEKYEYYRSELQRLAQERPKLNQWESQINSLKAELVSKYGEEALNHITD